jgi:uncharacterized protein (TIGR00661 family)
VGPIVRSEILKHREEKAEDFILVYVMDDSFRWILSCLQTFKDQKFIVTGIDPLSEETPDNIVLKNIDPERFLQDMAKCKAVIATAGHSLIGEALTFKKPLLVLRQPNQFEQFLNAFYLEDLQYGMSCKADEDIGESISRFLEDLPHFQEAISASFTPGNNAAADKITEIIRKLRNKVGSV